MKKYLAFIGCIVLAASCTPDDMPHARHVIMIGCDAMGAFALQRAETPNLNHMIENGAVSINTHSVRPTSSSQNWMSMVSGALPLQHGVLDNDWEPDNIVIEPCLKNARGFFPTLFDDIKAQRPEATVHMFYEWEELARMFDVSVVDKAVTGLDTECTFNAAMEDFFENKPALSFISLNEPDHVGHVFGHESAEYMAQVSQLDAMIGELVRRLDESGMSENTVVIVTADHGGLGKSHGGDSLFERLVPIVFYGKGVTRGKVIEPALLICDVAATVCGLLDVALPRECVGRFVHEAFTPRVNDRIYVPVPFVSPSEGFFTEPVTVTMTADAPDCEIYYTLDGLEPDTLSLRYEGPVQISGPAQLRAVTYRKGQRSLTAAGSLRVVGENESPNVSYRMWEGIRTKTLPVFSTLGRPKASGKVYEFSLDQLDVEEKDHFAVEFTADLHVDKAENYRFGVLSDDGSRVYIDGRLLIDNDGSHSSDMKYANIDLSEGLHHIKVEYFDDYMGQRLELRYSSGHIGEQVVPFARLCRN
ncbi:alkaline phosphatase family protein [Alistipes sp.]|uniref:alkaline phosphatase family protein n=1 Tax=Alistipes sp. TaxID=1872444 RepID=UPI0025BA8754|nr:alkaline phosphatase family protein [Alistipes sp.]